MFEATPPRSPFPGAGRTTPQAGAGPAPPAGRVVRVPSAAVPRTWSSCPGLRRKLKGPGEHGHRGLVVPPDHLVAAADPEQCLSLTTHVAYRLVQLGGTREECQLAGIFASLFRVVVALLEEAAMDKPAASQPVGLDRVEFPLGSASALPSPSNRARS